MFIFVCDKISIFYYSTKIENIHDNLLNPKSRLPSKKPTESELKEYKSKYGLSFRNFKTSEPVIIAESDLKERIKSLSILTTGLCGFAVYLMILKFNFDEILLPILCVFQFSIYFFVRKFIRSQVSSFQILPNFQIKFNRYTWFGKVKEKYSLTVSYYNNFIEISYLLMHYILYH